MAITDQEVEALEATHKRVAVVSSADDEWQVVYRRPTRQEYKRFRAMASNPDGQELLCRSIVVHPSKEAFDALLEEYPGIPEASSQAILKLAGMQAKDDLGK